MIQFTQLLCVLATLSYCVAQPGGDFCTAAGTTTFITPDAMGNTTNDCMTFDEGTGYQYPEDFSILSKFCTSVSGGVRTIISNGVPDHEIDSDGVGYICEIPWFVQIPETPTFVDTPIEPQTQGILGIALNGVPIYGAQEGGGTNALEGDNDIIVEWCGHQATVGDWHYHSSKMPISADGVGVTDDSLLGEYPTSTTQVGWAMDGYAIYGPVDNSSILDSCNGQWVDGTTYQYHLMKYDDVNENADYCDGSDDDGYEAAIAWDYIIGCLHGSLNNTVVGNYNDYSLADYGCCSSGFTTGCQFNPFTGDVDCDYSELADASCSTEAPTPKPTTPPPEDDDSGSDETIVIGVGIGAGVIGSAGLLGYLLRKHKTEKPAMTKNSARRASQKYEEKTKMENPTVQMT